MDEAKLQRLIVQNIFQDVFYPTELNIFSLFQQLLNL